MEAAGEVRWYMGRKKEGAEKCIYEINIVQSN